MNLIHFFSQALASAIAEEENLCKELEEEALKVDDDHDDDISSDRDYTVSDGRERPKEISDEIPLDSSVSTLIGKLLFQKSSKN